jgi:hypothetical protein
VRVYFSLLSIALLSPLLVPASASAQPPVGERVCDGLSGDSWGLCNAYCEVLDCEGENPNASSKACLNVLRKFQAHTDQEIPCARAECPCFAPEDVDTLLSECDDVGGSVICLDLVFQGQGTLFVTAMQCISGSDPPKVSRHLDAKIDERIGILASCESANVPPLPNGERETTVDQASRCEEIIENRFEDCDEVKYPR